MPQATIKRSIRDYVFRLWTKEWHASPMVTHSKAFYYSPNPCKAKYVYKLARLELGRFIRIITGHNNFNYFQTRIGLYNSSVCRFCDHPKETFLHILHDCPSFWQLRRDCFHDSQPSSDMQWSVRDLVEFSYTPAINKAIEGTWAHGDPPDVDDLYTDSNDNASAESDTNTTQLSID